MLRGRRRELAVVTETLARARAGHGAALVVTGAPGMGRTALLEHLLSDAAEGFRTLGVRAVAEETALPLAGLHALLVTCRPSAGRLRTATPRRPDERFALCAQVHRALAGAATAGPLLCWIDDAHWLDEVSLQALAFTARRIGGRPIAMLITTEAGAPVPTSGIPRVSLGALDGTAARELLDDLVGGGLGDDLAAHLVDLSAGNPLALTELAAALTPDQLAGLAPPPAGLPDHSRLRARHRRDYAALGPDARRLVLMAVCDPWLDTGTLARAAARAGLDLRELESARRSGLVRVDGDVVEIPDPLVRSSLYADAPLADRLAVHDLLAEVLAEDRLRQGWHRAASAGQPDARLSGELGSAAAAARRCGRHADAARVWRQAASLTADSDLKAGRLLAAATDAWLGGRTGDARALLRMVRPLARTGELRALAGLVHGQIELRDGVPAAGGQVLLDAADRLRHDHPTRAVLALMYAAEAAALAGDHRQGPAIAARAAGLTGSGPRSPVAELMLNHLTGMAAVLGGRHTEAGDPLRRVIELAGRVPGCAAKTWAATAAFALGADRRARELATTAVNRARLRGTAALLPWALSVLALTEMQLGEFTAATTACLEGLRAARACGQDNCAADHLAMLALLATVEGDPATARLRAEAAAGLVKERGLGRAGAVLSWALARLDLAEDRTDAGTARLRLLTAGAPADLVVAVLATPDFVEAAAGCGRLDGTAGALERFERWARACDGPTRAALAERCRALLAGGAEAEAHFAEALRLHRAGGSAFELARTEFMYGQRLRRGRRPRDAREHLRDARQMFHRCGAVYWAGRAEAELRAAGEPAEITAWRGAGELTPHQRRIAELVAGGATNREVAARLVLSPRTVDHHLRNIFARLGIRSRVELARIFP